MEEEKDGVINHLPDINGLHKGKQKEIVQIALYKWHYIDFYIESTLEYCLNARIITQEVYDELREPRLKLDWKDFPDSESYTQYLDD